MRAGYVRGDESKEELEHFRYIADGPPVISDVLPPLCRPKLHPHRMTPRSTRRGWG